LDSASYRLSTSHQSAGEFCNSQSSQSSKTGHLDIVYCKIYINKRSIHFTKIVTYNFVSLLILFIFKKLKNVFTLNKAKSLCSRKKMMLSFLKSSPLLVCTNVFTIFILKRHLSTDAVMTKKLILTWHVAILNEI
jgi:hypothetical protein